MIQTPKVSLIAAIGKNRELGRGNELVFQIPEDMKFFREKTRGHVVIMGRKTYESIGRLLPGRFNIILSRRPLEIKAHEGEKYTVVNSIEQALEEARLHESEEIFVIGGAQIYALAMPHADKLYLTLVDAEVPDADAFFPDYNEFKTVVSQRESRDKNYVYNFLEITR